MKRGTTKSYAGRQVDIEALKHVDRMLPVQGVLPSIVSDPVREFSSDAVYSAGDVVSRAGSAYRCVKAVGPGGWTGLESWVPCGFWEGRQVPRIVSGIEKAVQRYAKLFLTAVGSVRLDASVGSDLLGAIGRGEVSDISTLDSLYVDANGSALAAMAEDDLDTDSFGPIPDDERIVETSLVDMELDEGSSTIRIHVKITTAAGDDFTFVIPVSSGVTT